MDDPDIIVLVDANEGETGWDVRAGGRNWGREAGFADRIPPGTRRLRAVRVASDEPFTITLTVQTSLIGGGPNATMTVRDVTISPVTP